MGVVDIYEAELAAALQTAGAPRFVTDLLAAGHGAPPTTVRDMLHRMGRSLQGRPTYGGAYPAVPELHQLLYEWYFTQETAQLVSEVARGAGDTWLFLGVPSVAHEMSKTSPHVRLVDADVAVLDRFDGLADRAEVTIAEVGAASVAKSDVVVIDPPWYPADVARWIGIARRHVRPGGAIISTLFPPLTRPSAAGERQAIFAMAEGLGRVEFRSSCLRYSTPLFERESLLASGIPDPGDWRRADLLVIRGVDPGRSTAAPDVQPAHHGVQDWDRFQLGNQVVFMSQSATAPDEGTGPLRPIEGCANNVLPSVSERDPLRRQVGLWTSRNRVAAVSDPALVHDWLTRIQADGLASVTSDESSATAGQDEEAHVRYLISLLDVQPGTQSGR